MLTLTLSRAARKGLLGAALITGVVALTSSSASAQLVAQRQTALSPRAQRVLANIMRNGSVEGQQLVLNAIRKIGLRRADAQLSQFAAFSPSDQQLIGQVYASILQALPANYRQAFVNGLFQASPEEEQFANDLINRYAQSLNASVSSGPSNADFLFAQRFNRLLTLMNRW